MSVRMTSRHVLARPANGEVHPPGSRFARTDEGCTCDPHLNNHGDSPPGFNGTWWVAKDCPRHRLPGGR